MKKIINKTIVLTTLLLIYCPLFAQIDNVVSGRVTSMVDNEALIGVSVTEIDATNRVIGGTVTDLNGDYVLHMKNRANKIEFSYMGYKPQSVKITNSLKINIKLVEDEKMLEEVLITGRTQVYDGGLSVKQREISMAISKIEAKEFENISVSSVDEALQGRIAGLDIVSSGSPGTGSAMRIRGVTSITGNSQPLVVVNNIPFSGEMASDFDFTTANEDQYAELLNVNVDDIQEIVVLKDAASTAMWGSRGANGVLMITTKKGAKGRTRVQYSYRLSGKTQPAGMTMLSGDDYTMLMKQANFNRTLAGNETPRLVPEYNYDTSFPEYHNFNKNTDWVSAVTQTGWTHDHYLTISGGGERARFRVSGGYFDETGTVIGQDMKRYSFRSDLNYYISDRLRIDSEFQFTQSTTNRDYTDGTFRESILDIAYRKMPNVSILKFTQDGMMTQDYYNIRSDSDLDAGQKNLLNPVALANLAENKVKNTTILPTMRLSYDIIEPTFSSSFRYSGYVSLDVRNSETNKFLPGEVSNLSWDNSSVNYATGVSTEKQSVMTENKLTYITSFEDKHSIQAYLAVNSSTSQSNGQTIESYGHPGSNLSSPTSEAYMRNFENHFDKDRSISALARAHYVYLGRYIVDVNMRMDGSTKFGPNNRYGFFPGISAKWIISDEMFMSSFSEWLTLFAIRPSWGVSGNQPGANYLYHSRYTPDNVGYMEMSGTYPNSIKISNLRWEKVKSLNLGSDLELWEGMFAASFDYYKKRTTDMLFRSMDIPTTTGFSQISYKNAGTMDNEGWDLELFGNRLLQTSNFSMDFSLVFGRSKNTIIELDPLILAKYNDPGSSVDNGRYLSRLQEGNSYGSIYGFRYKGVYQYSYNNYKAGERENAPVARDANGNVMHDNNGVPKPVYYKYASTKYQFQGGDVIYEDINNDGSIDEYDIVYLGNSNPKLTGGFGTVVRYGNQDASKFGSFSANLFFNFRYGNKIVNRARMNAENMYTDNNQTTTTNWRWRKEGDITEVPRAVYNQAYNWLPSDRYVEDGSFLRLKYLTVRYSFPKHWITPVGLSQTSLYLTINNVFCLTKYSGVDPEVGYGNFGVSTDNSSTPRAKSWTFGINTTF